MNAHAQRVAVLIRCLRPVLFKHIEVLPDLLGSRSGPRF